MFVIQVSYQCQHIIERVQFLNVDVSLVFNLYMQTELEEEYHQPNTNQLDSLHLILDSYRVPFVQEISFLDSHHLFN